MIKELLNSLFPQMAYAGVPVRHEKPQLALFKGAVDIVKGVVSGQDSSSAPAPIVQAPAEMPTADSEAVLREKRRKANEIASRSGRASTIMTDYSMNSEKLG